jgi:lipoprotein NlpI
MRVAVASAALLFATSLSAHADNGCRPPMDQRMIAGCSDIIDRPGATDAERSEALRLRAIGNFELGHMEAARADFTAFIALNPDFAKGYGARYGPQPPRRIRSGYRGC